jgi:hypothetical protein
MSKSSEKLGKPKPAKKKPRKKKPTESLKTLVKTAGDLECWMSEGFEKFGQMQIIVSKRIGRSRGICVFLLDRGVAGLKDIMIQLDRDRWYLNTLISRPTYQAVEMRPCEPEEAKRWILGAARWAHEHQMRLPKDWMQAAALLGDVSDWQSADLSGFVKEFYGHPNDLRQRFLGENLESFLHREDITFTFDDSAPYKDLNAGGYFNVQIDERIGDMLLQQLKDVLDPTKLN